MPVEPHAEGRTRVRCPSTSPSRGCQCDQDAGHPSDHTYGTRRWSTDAGRETTATCTICGAPATLLGDDVAECDQHAFQAEAVCKHCGKAVYWRAASAVRDYGFWCHVGSTPACSGTWRPGTTLADVTPPARTTTPEPEPEVVADEVLDGGGPASFEDGPPAGWSASPVTATAREQSPLGAALAASVPRVQWLLGQALTGQPLRDCALSDCRWAARRHVYAPDCGPARERA